LRERLEVRKVLDRAKGRLQSERGFSEPEAFRWIQKTSMDRRVTMRAVAEDVLAGALPERAPGGGTADGGGRPLSHAADVTGPSSRTGRRRLPGQHGHRPT
jgi:response regulator NasT